MLNTQYSTEIEKGMPNSIFPYVSGNKIFNPRLEELPEEIMDHILGFKTQSNNTIFIFNNNLIYNPNQQILGFEGEQLESKVENNKGE